MEFVDKYLQPFLEKVPILLSPISSIFAMFIIVYLSKLQHVLYSILFTFNYDLVNASYRNGSKKSWNQNIVQRAYNAHQNSWEALIGFSIPVILILQQNIISNEINQLCNLFICTRVAFSIVYPLAFAVPISMIRSGIFAVGMAVIIKLFIIAVPNILV